jgi:hypothetical protein
MYSSGNPDQAGTTELNDNTTIIAHYKTQFTIEARATPGGQVSPGGVNWYDKGTPLNLSAIPDKGFTFVEWKIETQYVDTKSQSLYIPMLVGGGVITAVFARERDTLPPTIKLFGLFNPGDVCWSREVKLSAIYSDNVLIDVSSVRLKIDGENVTSGVSCHRARYGMSIIFHLVRINLS